MRYHHYIYDYGINKFCNSWILHCDQHHPTFVSLPLPRLWVDFKSFKHLLDDKDLQKICIERKILEKQQIEYKQHIKLEAKAKRDKEEFERCWERLEKERQEEVERLKWKRFEFERLELLCIKKEKQ